MSETLYVEGPDRDVLIAEIRALHGPNVTIKAVRPVRRGGVLGFFSRQRLSVAYELTSSADAAEIESSASEPATLAELVERADAYDGRPDDSPSPSPPDVFARVLEQLATAPSTATAGSTVELDEPAPLAAVTGDRPPARPGAAARARLGMLSQLRSLGVPVTSSPEAGETSLYRAIEQVVDELPPAPPAPTRAGQVLVLAGCAHQVADATVLLARLHHLPPQAIWSAGVSGANVITGPLDAARRVEELRSSDVAAIVAIGLDDAPAQELRSGWAVQIIAALQPDAVWAALDAGRKTEDLRAELDLLGPIDALVVSGGARTRSPATVWDLEVPIALLDGRPASAGAWTGLLFDTLRSHGEA